MASHRMLADGEQVQINYAGEIRQLDNSGLSDIAYRRGPVVRNVPVTIRTDGLMQSLAISMGIAAICPIIRLPLWCTGPNNDLQARNTADTQRNTKKSRNGQQG